MTIQQFFEEHPIVAVAFSGGADSGYLLCEAKRYAFEVTAVYLDTPFQPAFVLPEARAFCEAYAVPFVVLSYDALENEAITANPANRCYHCKTAMFTLLRDFADAHGIPDILDGTNASDDPAHRPGMRALTECGVYSPLRLCGMTKPQILEASRERGLPTADKPPYSCLATKIPTGEVITAEGLQRVAVRERG